MKIRDDHYRNTSDFDGEQGNATLNMERLSLFMEQMISNYNFPELAVLREWISNGYDSHVASQNSTDRVKVTLPSALNPQLIVQDFGAGMSHEFVTDVYLDFGSSSKAEGNDEIGGFGIGGKSALAIASQYTMTTIHEGLKSVFIFERSPKGGVGYKAVISRQPTDERSGVTVTVAVDRFNEYKEKNLNRVLGGWSNSEIELSSGKEFFSIPDSSKKTDAGYILEDAVLSSGSTLTSKLNLEWGDQAVLVGPVLYVFQPENRSFQVAKDFFVPTMEIGEVTFPSSREVIEPTRSNRERVSSRIEKLTQASQLFVQEKVDAVDSYRAALQLQNSPLAKIQLQGSITFNGEPVPDSFETKAGDSIFEYKHTGGWQGVSGYKLVESNKSKHYLNIQSLIVPDDESSVQSIRNNLRLLHTSSGVNPKDLSGLLVISSKPSEWVKASSALHMEASKLAEKAKEIRREKRDADAALKASGQAPAPVERRTRRDRVGEYSSTQLAFGQDEKGALTVTAVEQSLMEFYDEFFDEGKTLVLSTNADELSASAFIDAFLRLKVNPDDVQFLHVETRAKLETLRLLLGEEVKITGIREWIQDELAPWIVLEHRAPETIRKEIPFQWDSQVDALYDLVKDTVGLHSEYRRLKALDTELKASIQAVEGGGNRFYGYSNSHYEANRLVNSVVSKLESFSESEEDEEVVDRGEFFFLDNLSFYRYTGLSEDEKRSIVQVMNQMMENWLDNLALQEAEAQGEALSARGPKIKVQAPGAMSISS